MRINYANLCIKFYFSCKSLNKAQKIQKKILPEDSLVTCDQIKVKSNGTNFNFLCCLIIFIISYVFLSLLTFVIVLVGIIGDTISIIRNITHLKYKYDTLMNLR